VTVILIQTTGHYRIGPYINPRALGYHEKESEGSRCGSPYSKYGTLGTVYWSTRCTKNRTNSERTVLMMSQRIRRGSMVTVTSS
jgi:hypothetical protein